VIKIARNRKSKHLGVPRPQLEYIEKAFCNTGSKNFGEVTQKMLEYDGQPGSNDGTGLLQTIASLKVREIYENLTGAKVKAAA
jgi:phosphoribulokinase